MNAHPTQTRPPKQKQRAGLLTLAALGVCGCGQAGLEDVRSSEARLDGKDVPAEAVKDQTRRNTTFALALYQQLRRPGENLFFSPLSITTALAMTYAGAAGQTAQQLEQVLRIDATSHAALNVIDQALNSRGQGQGGQAEAFRLTTVSALFGQRGYPYLPPFLSTLARFYGAGLRALDFAAAPEPARATINDWVAGRTEGKIPALLPEGSITGDTRLVLTNAVSFKAAWLNRFDRGATANGDWIGDGGTTRAPLMQRRATFNYASVAGVDVVELPYQGQEVSLLVLAPPAGQLGAFEQSLSEARLAELLGQLQPQDMILTMPRFRVESERRLKEPLMALGLRDALLAGAADLSGMDGTRRLYLSEVHHKAVIDLNEDGTEAAAATGGIVSEVSLPPLVTINRPFLYLIRDKATGAVIFLGRLASPQ